MQIKILISAMNTFLKICVLLASLQGGFQLSLLDDGDLQGIILDPFKQVHVQNYNEMLAYQLNLTVIHTTLEKNSRIMTKCHNKKAFENIRFIELQHEWKSSEAFQIKNVTEIFMPKIETVKKLLNSENRCFVVDQIASNIHDIVESVDNLLKFRNEMSSYFVSYEKIRIDAQNLLTNGANDYMTPFTYDEFFLRDFKKFAKGHYFYSKQSLYIVFIVPIYAKKVLTLYKISPKPIIYDKNAYIYKTNTSCAVFEDSQFIAYTDRQFRINCFEALKQHFVKNHMIHLTI